MATSAIDQDKFEALMGKTLGDIGAAMSMLLAYVGDRLGFFRAPQAKGPATREEAARPPGRDERSTRDWLSGPAAAGYVDYDPAPRRFSLSPEAELIFAAEGD